MEYYLFICFLLNSSLIIIYHQAILNVCICWSSQGVHRLGIVTNIGLFCQCTVKGSVLLCLQGHIDQWVEKHFYSLFTNNWTYLLYLSHSHLSNLVWVFPNAFQEILEFGHRDLLDLFSQSRQVFSHNLTESVLTDPADRTAKINRLLQRTDEISFRSPADSARPS